MTTKDAVDATEIDETEPETVTDEPVDEVDDVATETETQSEKRDGISRRSTGVESMTDDSAVVLVSATSRVTNSAGAKQEPRSWRLSVNLERIGDQIKMSKVEFVP